MALRSAHKILSLFQHSSLPYTHAHNSSDRGIVATAKTLATGGVAFVAVKEIFPRVEKMKRRFGHVEQSKCNLYHNMVEPSHQFKKMDGK